MTTYNENELTHFSVQYSLGGKWHSAQICTSREQAASVLSGVKETFDFAQGYRVMGFPSAAHANRVTAWGCEKAAGTEVTL